MILGLDRPTEGTVTVAGRAYRELAAPMREVGALLDAKAVHGKRSARSVRSTAPPATSCTRAPNATPTNARAIAPPPPPHRPRLPVLCWRRDPAPTTTFTKPIGALSDDERARLLLDDATQQAASMTSTVDL
jgi:hypothetical protein